MTQTIQKAKVLLFTLLFACTVTASGFLVMSPRVSAEDVDLKKNACAGADLKLSGDGTCNDKVCVKKEGDRCVERGDQTQAESSVNRIVQLIVNILTTIVGVVAVIMIIVGGFKYVTSGGDSGKISSAKSTIIYSIVGLIIVALAQVIVRFVLSKV